MQKIFSFFLFILIFACGQVEIIAPATPSCISEKTIASKPTILNVYSYKNEFYYEFVFGSLDNGGAFLLSNTCDTICAYGDDLNCRQLGDDFFSKRKLVR